ncbi:MAG: heavy metal-binding domain-containing protein [Bryobacteraceae bacterium]
MVLVASLLLQFAVTAPQPPKDYVCPMDVDVRSASPAKCPRCGMKLVLHLPDPAEFPVSVSATPRAAKAGEPVELAFDVTDPHTGRRVTKFDVVHEKLFHLFVISADLQFFAHVHPEFGPDGLFRWKGILPKSGAYRLVSDFYPAGATPQISARTFLTAGYKPNIERPKLASDLAPQDGENVHVELRTEPAQPLAGQKTLLFFTVTPAEGLEQYLGAWGHLLAASDDLVDTIHTHPFIASGGADTQFNIIFPREAMYRIWVQFQRQGKVNTVSFTIPVTALR